MKIAFLYPGQGSQQAGMGSSLISDPEIRELAEKAAAASTGDLLRLVTEADEDELRRTENTQPALCFVSLAITRLLRRRGIVPAAAAGHSVGEYAALAAAGALSEEDAMRAVMERGREMAAAVPAGESTMAAVLGLDGAAVESALAALDDVWPANYNTPTQVVVGGRTAAMDEATEKLRAGGARRVVPLNVSAAFHTPLMRPAAERFADVLHALDWHAPAVPVAANVNGLEYSSAGDTQALLEQQLYSPVRWGECVATLLALGCDTFIEVGPKRALAGMMRELAPGSFVVSVGSADAVDQLELTRASN